MAVEWNQVAIALASRLQFEQACRRSRLLTEDFTKIVLAEAVQAYTSGSIDPEYNHPDVPGDARIDLLVRSPQAANIEAAIEHKWIRATTDTTSRNWLGEILADLLRLERLDAEIVQASERVLVIAGEVEQMRRRLWERKVNVGNGQQRVRVVDNLMQSRPDAGDVQDAPALINLRDDGAPFSTILASKSGELFNQMPSRYQIQLIGHHRTHTDGVECVAWRITRPAGQRSTFDGATQW